MGIDLNTVRFLTWTKSRGVSFRKTAMLGRQGFMGVRPSQLARWQSAAPQGARPGVEILTDPRQYCEPLFKALKAETIHSYDFSSYENATHLWDLNEAPPAASLGAYSVVFDGGTLEHVFDFPRALQGALQLLEPGGHYISVTPASGWFGHGFYQFSAELFQQIFTAGNGCELTALMMFEDREDAAIYEVQPPGPGHERHKFASLRPASLAVVARRVGPMPDRLRAQQSDYVAAWETSSAEAGGHAPRMAGSASSPLASLAGGRWGAVMRRWLKGRYLAMGGNPFFDTSMYRKVEM